MDNDDFLLSSTLIALLKGVVSETSKDKLWNTIKENQAIIEDYVSKIGLTLVIHNDDGYAYLKQRSYDNDEKTLPQLTVKRQLNFLTSLSLVLLRKELTEVKNKISDERVIMSKESFFEKIRPYLKNSTDEVKQKKDIDTTLRKIEDMGFIRFLDNNSDFEIFLLVRGFVTAQLLVDIDTKLKEYMEYNSIDIANEDGGI